MSKTTDLIEKLSQESEEFNKSYKDAKLHSDFIDIIYELKDEYDLSNSQVALKADKNRSTINRIITGEMNPTLKLMNEIAEPFGKEVKVTLVDK